MAQKRIYRCDKCQKEVSYEEKEFIRMGYVIEGTPYEKHKDLCRACFAELALWFKRG